MTELYNDHFRRQERLREKIEEERVKREELLAQECTFSPRISRQDNTDEGGENDVTRRLYQDAATKSIKMQKLIARLHKKKLMHEPTFKPSICEQGEQEDFDVEKLTERLFQNGKEAEARRERARDKFFKTVCTFQPNANLKMKKADDEEEALDIEKMVERLYSEEVVKAQQKKEWQAKKRRKAEGLTFQPNKKGGEDKKLDSEGLEKLVEGLWQESKERQARQAAVRRKEDKRIKENVGKLPKDMYRRPGQPVSEPLSPEELGAKLYGEKDLLEENHLKLRQAKAKAMLRECNNFSPIIEKGQVSKEYTEQKILEVKHFGHQPLAKGSPKKEDLGKRRGGYTHPLDPLGKEPAPSGLNGLP